jgi:hypothetical protein
MRPVRQAARACVADLPATPASDKTRRMKQFMRLFSFSAVLALGAGVAHAEFTKADGDKFVAFFDKLADTVVADKDDCVKMGTDMNAQIDANKDVLAKVDEARKSGKPMAPELRDHLMATSRKMAPAVEKCKGDKNVAAAFTKLPHGPPAKH